MENLFLENNIENNLSLEKNQKKFLENKIGKLINKGINLGLKYILPDLVENQIIEIKDTVISNGFSEGVKKAIDLAVDFGKSAMGVVTGNFENINQVQTAVKKGGIIDSVSGLLDVAVKKGVSSGKISENIGRTIEKGKNTILDTINRNIEQEFEMQLDSIEKLEKYENNWEKYYQLKDFEGMQREYDKIQEKLKDIVPIENTLNRAKEISNLHILIKNKGKNFDLTNEELELIKKI